jgi:hypothetical protein
MVTQLLSLKEGVEEVWSIDPHFEGLSNAFKSYLAIRLNAKFKKIYIFSRFFFCENVQFFN